MAEGLEAYHRRAAPGSPLARDLGLQHCLHPRLSAPRTADGPVDLTTVVKLQSHSKTPESYLRTSTKALLWRETNACLKLCAPKRGRKRCIAAYASRVIARCSPGYTATDLTRDNNTP